MFQNDHGEVLQNCPDPVTMGAMTAMSLSVEIGEAEERPGSLVATVTIADERYEKILVIFDYLLEGEEDAKLHVVQFEPRAEILKSGDVLQLTPALIRDFPMSQWDRIAQAAVRRSRAVHELRGARHSIESSHVSMMNVKPAVERSAAAPLEQTTPAGKAPDLPKPKPEDVVRLLAPDLNPDQGPGARRRWNSLMRYVRIYTEYEELLAQGNTDPITNLALQNDVAKATVRSWLHRAREAGVDKVVQLGLSQLPLFQLPENPEPTEDGDR
ncbi:hypothetical protein [Streptomyces sp. NPDC088766]|uniref:hypothetical protein n=1 Tax=Streptomyces sp. NPDC088766 TaxID=3365893 RepID=UPI00382DDCCE